MFGILDATISKKLEKAGYTVIPAKPPKGCYVRKWVVRFGDEVTVRDLILYTSSGYRLWFRDCPELIKLLEAETQPAYF